MSTPALAFSNIDFVLRDLVKQNAALLELVAYGDSVYPTKAEFYQEHRNFVANATRAFSQQPCFIVSAIEHGQDLPVIASFGTDELSVDVNPEDDLFAWLQGECKETKGELGKRIEKWLIDNKQTRTAEMYIAPYAVTRAFGKSLPDGGVPAAVRILRSDEDVLNKFLYTTPVAFSVKRLPTATKDAYFRGFACVGVTREWKNSFEGKDDDDRDKGKSKGNFEALLESLMIFYQMSWSNLSIIKSSGEKEQKSREKQAALTYGMIREPIEKLVEHLRAAQPPLNRLEAVLSPVRGLFASNIVGEKFFMDGRQTFKILSGPHTIEIRHHFASFADDGQGQEDWTERAAEQIAAVLLSGLGELEGARQPLWEYLRYALRFTNSYRQVAEILLERFSAVFERGRSNLMDCATPLGELFDLAKYWFLRAGRVGEPMRADYLAAGLGLIFPEDAGTDLVQMVGVSNTGEFWVSSELPVHTLSGLEALCRDFGDLSSATLRVKNEDPNQIATLDLKFSGRSAKAVAEAELDGILKSCQAFKDRSDATRGNMVYAMMQIFGDVPQWNVEQEGQSRTFYREVGQKRASITFGNTKGETESIVIEWTAPAPKGDHAPN